MDSLPASIAVLSKIGNAGFEIADDKQVRAICEIFVRLASSRPGISG
jgi:hypothetical protein